jgi:aspartyl aminopeptidase
MQGRFFENFLAELLYKTKGDYNDMYIRTALTNSMCLSSDVTNGVDPTYKSVSESNNAAYIGGGVALCKYTGTGGKGSTSDANAEYVGKIRSILNNADVTWQICELGKVDQGGGGTVAKYIAKLDVDTIDIGVPLLSMHAPMEIASKIDIYNAFRVNGYLLF